MTVALQSRFLDLRALAGLEHMRFTTRHRIEGAFSGRNRSRSLNGAGEFVDYREYSPGEDPRRLDWKVLARAGRAYIRLYQDETNLACTLALDTSRSMSFGGEAPATQGLSKLAYAQFLSTALAHVIARGQDQVGLALLGAKLRELIPPGSTPGHLARLHGAIEKVETEPTTRMSASLGELFEKSTRRGVLLVLSDFLMEDLEQVFATIRQFRHRQWEIIVLHLIDPDEERLPEGVAYRFVGLEDEGSLDCSPADIRRQYQERFALHLATVRSMALALNCDYRPISTVVSYLQVLRDFLVERAG